MFQLLPPALITDRLLAPLMVLVGVVGLTVFVQLRCLIDKQFRTAQLYQHLWKRITAWWGMFAVFVAVTIFGSQLSLLIWAGCSALALWHYQKILDLRVSEKRALFWSFLFFIPLQYWLIYTEWYALFAICIPVYGFIFVPLRSVFTDTSEGFLERTASVQWGLMVCVYFVSHAPALFTLQLEGVSGAGGLLLLFLFAVVEGGDMLRYVATQKTKNWKPISAIIPEVSFGNILLGLIAGMGIAALLSEMMPFSLAESLLLGVIVSVMGQAGDLVMKTIKLDRGKPSTGGLLEDDAMDRIDSLCFAAPVYFHLVRYFFVV